MSYKLFSVFVFLGTIISWLSLVMMIFYFNPAETGFLGFSLFYLGLFLALSGLIFIVSDKFKKKIFKKQLLFNRLRVSLRHAILFTVLILSWLFMRSTDLLRWWNLLLLVLILAALEFFFMSYQKQGKNNYERETSTT